MRRTKTSSQGETEAEAGGLALGRLAPLLGFHLRMASAAIARDFATAMDGTDLTQKQYAVLELIAANPHVSQIDLSQALGTDRATMMAITDRLEARGLVGRQRSPRDGRRQELLLTAEGRALLADARRRIARHERRFIAQLGPERSKILMAMLGAVIATPAR
jgi:DNA-binding MarR family transcriptional regulator